MSNRRSPPYTLLDVADGEACDGAGPLGGDSCFHRDSMLVKLTCYGHDFPNAVRRARWATAEFRIGGLASNLPFFAAVLNDPTSSRAGSTPASSEAGPTCRMRPSADGAHAC